VVCGVIVAPGFSFLVRETHERSPNATIIPSEALTQGSPAWPDRVLSGCPFTGTSAFPLMGFQRGKASDLDDAVDASWSHCEKDREQ